MPSKLAILIAVFAAAFAAGARAQTLATGSAKYQRGDFRGAERVLTAALRSETRRDEKAATLKLLGICQYMLGDKAGASASFRSALALDPRITIAANEVLDDTVIDFFTKQRAATQAAEAAAPAPAPAAVSPPGAAAPGSKSAKAKRTLLKVVSDTPGAQVLMEGIIAGPANSELNVEPGTLEITVQAPGYADKHVRVTVVKDRATTVSVTLAKPKPKEPARGREPKAEPRSDARAPAVAEARKPRKKPKKKQPDAGEELFGDGPANREGAQAQPAVDPTDEFNRDVQGGAYPPPPPAYGPGGQPAYAAQPPGGYAPAYPPPPPPPPAGGGDAFVGASPASPEPPLQSDPQYEDYAEGGGKRKGNLFVALLPFGAGQFQNGEYLLGGALLGAEAFAGYYYFSKTQAANDAQSQRNEFVSEKVASNQDFTDSDRAYVASTDAYVAQERQAATYGLIGFGVAWAGGAVEAILHEPKAEKKSKSRHRRSGFGFVAPDHVRLFPTATAALAAPGPALVAPMLLQNGLPETLAVKLGWDL